MTTVHIANGIAEIKTSDGHTIRVRTNDAVEVEPPLTPESKLSRFSLDCYRNCEVGDEVEVFPSDMQRWMCVEVTRRTAGRIEVEFDDGDQGWFLKGHADKVRWPSTPSELATLRKDLASTRRETGEWSTRVSQIAKSLGLGDAPRCGESYAEFAGRCEAAIEALKKREACDTGLDWLVVHRWREQDVVGGASTLARALIKARESGAIR